MDIYEAMRSAMNAEYNRGWNDALKKCLELSGMSDVVAAYHVDKSKRKRSRKGSVYEAIMDALGKGKQLYASEILQIGKERHDTQMVISSVRGGLGRMQKAGRAVKLPSGKWKLT